jgi:hypothetical protein
VQILRRGPVPRGGDVVVFGAPGALFTEGKMHVSEAGRERAELAARYWLSQDPESQQRMRIICVAGRSGYRGHIPSLPPGKSEAAEMTSLMQAMGVPADACLPNEHFPIRREYSISTVDEVAVLVDEELIKPDFYGPKSPLVLVLHRRHGARAIDVFRKIGFKKKQLYLLSPRSRDSFGEVLIRIFYRALVLGGPKLVSVGELRQREERLMAASESLRRRWPFF